MHSLFRSVLGGLATVAAFLAIPAEAKPAARAAAVEAPARPALWKLADADTTIYLFGTIHALPKGVNWFNGEVARAFAVSQELVTEIVDSGDSAAKAELLQIAMLPEGQTLREQLALPERDGLEKALADLSLPNHAFDRFEPWYAAVALSTLPLLQVGFAPENGVDAALAARARRLQRPHVGLETMEYQLGLFDGLPLEVQKTYLAAVLKQMPTIRDELLALVDNWKRGNAEKLAELMNAEEEDPVLVARLITDRNRAWAEWIDERMDRPGVVFVAVGAGHLAGPGSVQDELARRGFTTRRVQ